MNTIVKFKDILRDRMSSGINSQAMVCDDEMEKDNGQFYINTLLMYLDKKKIIGKNLVINEIVSPPFSPFEENDIATVKDYVNMGIAKVFYCSDCSSFDNSFVYSSQGLSKIMEIPITCIFYIMLDVVDKIYKVRLISNAHMPSFLFYTSYEVFSNVLSYSKNSVINISPSHHLSITLTKQFSQKKLESFKDKESLFKHLNCIYMNNGEPSIEISMENGIQCVIHEKNIKGISQPLQTCKFTLKNNKSLQAHETIEYSFYKNPKTFIGNSSLKINDKSHLNIFITKCILNGTKNEILQDKTINIDLRELINNSLKEEAKLLPKSINRTSTNKMYSSDNILTIMIPGIQAMDIARNSLNHLLRELESVDYHDVNNIIKVADRLYDNKVSVLDILSRSTIAAKLFDSKKSTEVEFHTGSIINLTRYFIPNFMYTYAMNNCLLNEGFCVKNGDADNLLFLEYIEGEKLETLLYEKENESEIYSILCQVIIAIIIANDLCGFNHGDLYSKNIMVKDLKQKIKLTYVLFGKKYELITSKLAVIIDYGHAVIDKNKINYSIFPSEISKKNVKDHAEKCEQYVNEYMYEEIALYYPYRDIYSLIMSISGYIDPTIFERFFELAFPEIKYYDAIHEHIAEKISSNRSAKPNKILSPHDRHDAVVAMIEKDMTGILSEQLEKDYRYLNILKLVKGNGSIRTDDGKLFVLPNIFTVLDIIYTEHDKMKSPVSETINSLNYVYGYPH